MKKYLVHLLHGLAVYAAAAIPQLFSGPVDRSLLVSLVPGFAAAVASAVFPKVDSVKVEKAAQEVIQTVLPTTGESKLAPTTPTSTN